MLRGRRNPTIPIECGYGCCTEDWKGNPRARAWRRVLRKREGRAWRKDQDLNRP